MKDMVKPVCDRMEMNDVVYDTYYVILTRGEEDLID